MSAVTLTGITKQYDDGFTAVDGLDLSIYDGEFLVMVGPSGCGKSTTLRMIAGLEQITSGTIKIGDRVVNGLHPKDRDIAMVFQSYALYPHKSVYQNIAFALRVARVPKAEIDQRVRDAAKILDLTDQLDKKPANLSGGQRQRVAMGRAIVRTPQVFLLDEPLSNLDAKLRVQMRGEITSLQQRVGVTTFYVTHDQVEAMTMADRVAVIHDGLLQQVGPPQELFDQPSNLFVAAFIGSPPMNLMEASITTNAHDRLMCQFGSTTIELTDMSSDAPLRGFIDKPVVAGIRPKDFQLATESTAQLHAYVTQVEALGHERILYFDLDAQRVVVQIEQDEVQSLDDAGTRIAARFPSDTNINSGDTIPLTVRVDNMHFFDPDSGSRVG